MNLYMQIIAQIWHRKMLNKGQKNCRKKRKAQFKRVNNKMSIFH